MRRDRREFMRVGAAGLAGVAGAAGTQAFSASSSAESPSPADAPFSLALQFYGFSMHGVWKALTAGAHDGWDVLLLNEMAHKPRLRMPLNQVVNPDPKYYTTARTDPYTGIWDLKNKDLIIKLDGTARGVVKPVVDKRPRDTSGRLAECPRKEYPDDYLDTTWIVDFYDIFQSIGRDVFIRPELGKDTPDMKKDDLLGGRVRLAAGSIACGRPSEVKYEEYAFQLRDSSYPRQFYTDLVHYTSNAAPKITIELIPFGARTGLELELKSAGGAATVVAFVENTDPMAMPGTIINNDDACKYHFMPFYKLLGDLDAELKRCLVQGFCNGAPDPPYFCVPSKGNFTK